MSWDLFQVTLKLNAPLHVGWRKQGNIQYTFPYAHGRVMWGALTNSLTRLEYKNPQAEHYQDVGQKITEQMRFFYFFPMTKEKTWFPGDPQLNAHLVHSYTSGALDYECGTAAEGLLHEVEYICPYDKISGEQVHLAGYLAVRANCELRWEKAIERLLIGGERGYGFGNTCLFEPPKKIDGQNVCIFNSHKAILDNSDEVRVKVPKEGLLLAHTRPDVEAQGTAAPFVGRMWNNSSNNAMTGPGRSVVYHGYYWQPGSAALKGCEVRIGDFGIWEKVA